jgi:hypothetical protein
MAMRPHRIERRSAEQPRHSEGSSKRDNAASGSNSAARVGSRSAATQRSRRKAYGAAMAPLADGDPSSLTSRVSRYAAGRGSARTKYAYRPGAGAGAADRMPLRGLSRDRPRRTSRRGTLRVTMVPEPGWVAERGACEGWEEPQWLGWETIKARFAEAGAEVRPMDSDGVFLDGQDVPFLAEHQPSGHLPALQRTRPSRPQTCGPCALSGPMPSPLEPLPHFGLIEPHRADVTRSQSEDSRQ